MEISHEYDDIIHLPHHVSEDRPHMPLIDRGAQFAPFAALTGYGDAIEETARLTERKRELSEEQKAVVSDALQELLLRGKDGDPVTVVFFEPDGRKTGGVYRTVTGTVAKVDGYRGTLQMLDGTAIPFDSILDLEL